MQRARTKRHVPTRATANESKYPNVVELAVGGNVLDVTLGRRIINFHNLHPHHGRTIIRQRQIFYRWCFSDMGTAREFIEQFGGSCFGCSQIAQDKKRLAKGHREPSGQEKSKLANNQ
jgi:hypothetical protein